MPQAYANPGGKGNRTASITVTTTATLGAGSISALVEGTQGDTMWFANAQSGREVKFDFGTARLITEAKWYQDTTSSHGTWQWQGSPDNTAWTSIGSTFTLGGVVTQTITTLSGNATSYRYYRMLQTAGATSSGPYLREIEFSIDGVLTDVNDVRVTQVAVEHWLNTDPQAQITQVALEHWMSVSSTNLQAIVTQVVLEHWTSVASVSLASGGPQVTMIH